MIKGKVVLQEIMLDNAPYDDHTKEMYYRGNLPIRQVIDGGYLIKKGCFYDFFTYFNSLSIGKWQTYTSVEEFGLELEMKGKFSIDLMGHYVNGRNEIQKEWLGRFYFELAERQKITLAYPRFCNSMVVAFQITSLKDAYIYAGNYIGKTELEKVRSPYVAMVTTTFRKESYILKNVELLNQTLFLDSRFANHFFWKIIDNGATLNHAAINNEHIEVIQNKNVGGSGGFARGMLEAITGERKPTHILLMDDDVVFFPDSFRRLYTMLMLAKPEFEEHFISGAMLEITQQNIQHEDIGVFSLNGTHGPAKPRYDLNLWSSVVRNEVLIPPDVHQYGGWWYCCIPVKYIRRDNLPIPFFVRGDDVEYAIRNHAKFITMNGICIWHEGFGSKFSGALELYQVHRNDLILKAMHDEVADVNVIQRITYLFWEEMYKFNYCGASLLLDAVEDYLKGPVFLKEIDGEQCMREKRTLDNQMYPVTDEIRAYVDYENLNKYRKLNRLKKLLYDYSYNGHRLPIFLAKKKPGIIPYGWGYHQAKQYLTKVNYAIDPINNLYAVYERSNKKFKELKIRFKNIMERYQTENDSVAEAYRNAEKEMESREYWENYLSP